MILLKASFKHIIFLFLLLSIQNSIVAQNYNLKLKPDSISNYLDETLIKKTFNSKIEIINYLDSISTFLIFNGFINNYYELKDVNSEATACFKLNSKIDTIQVNIKNEQIDFSKISSPIKILNSNYIEFSTKYTNTILDEISSSYGNQGYSFTQVSLINLNLKNSKIQGELTINPSPKRHINDIIIKGYSEISKKQFKNILQLNNKNIFNKESLVGIEKTINSISFVEQIKPPEVLFTKDSTFLYLYLKKKSNNQINGIIGFSTNSTSEVILNGDLDLELSNIFNRGESFNLNWKSYDSNSSLQTHLNLPTLLTPYISFKGGFSLTKQDTLYTTSQGRLNLIFNINRSHSIGGILDFESSNLTNTTPIDNFNNYKKKGFGIAYSFSSFTNITNSPFNFSIEYLKNKKNKIEKLENLNILIENIFEFNNKNNVFFKLRGQVLNSPNLYENELFKIGGYKSLRGFDELSIQTSKYILTNIEYRYYLNKKNLFYSITDLAFTNNTQSLEKKSLVGLGLGYLFTTNNSILNLSYASGNTINGNTKNNKSKIYLNVSYLF